MRLCRARTFVAIHFVPLTTGHPACSDVVSCVLPSGLRLKNSSASPLRGRTPSPFFAHAACMGAGVYACVLEGSLAMWYRGAACVPPGCTQVRLLWPARHGQGLTAEAGRLCCVWLGGGVWEHRLAALLHVTQVPSHVGAGRKPRSSRHCQPHSGSCVGLGACRAKLLPAIALLERLHACRTATGRTSGQPRGVPSPQGWYPPTHRITVASRCPPF